MWYKEETMKISVQNKKIHSIQIKVDLYEVCLSYNIYFLLFLFYDHTDKCFRLVSGISLTRRNQFRKYWQKVFELEEDKNTDKWWN